MLYVLDSTVLVDYLRGRPVVSRLRELMRRRDDLATTAINVDEVARGMRPGEEQKVAALFDALYVLPITRDGAWQAGRWRQEFATRGVTLWQGDCLIAATAVHAGATLTTGNPKDFPMAELAVQHWPVGQ